MIKRFFTSVPGISFWKPVLLWTLWFSVWRFLFTLFYYNQLEGSFLHRMAAYPAGLRLDVTTACYMHFVWLGMYLIYQWWNKRFLLYAAVVIHWVLVLVTTFIIVGNMGLYGTWQTPMNNRMLLYLQNPSEIMHFIPLWQVIALPIVVGVITWFASRWSMRFYLNVTNENTWWKKGIATIYIPCIFILALRGGWQQMPINESASCYSFHARNNHAAINPVFYFGHSVGELFSLKQAYHFYSEENVNENLQDYLVSQPAPGTDTMLTTQRPNVVIILLESWCADVLNNKYKGHTVTPFTDSLLKQSLWFTNAYGPGYRTDQGLITVLSGYPCQPDNSIIAFPAKTESLPSLSQELKKNGYPTSFFYGGELEFANMKNYLVQKGFQHFSDKHDFPSSEWNSKWGAHDENVLMKQISFLKKEKQPFLSCVLTLSTHEPFEVPLTSPFTGSDEPEKFMHAAYYTDYSLKKYFAKASRQPWYNNTLFILVADHGHRLPMNRDMNHESSRKVTLFMTGPALKVYKKGMQITYPVSQVDIARTVLDWMKIDASAFTYSRNMFTTGKHFAYFTNENVLGWVEDDRVYRYFFDIGRSDGPKELEKPAKSYLQKAYADFISR